MRPGLAREIVRNTTSYRVGRTLVDILLGLNLVGLVVLGAFWIAGHGWPESQAQMLAAAEPAAIGILSGIFSILLREIVHALFDLADATLNRPDADK